MEKIQIVNYCTVVLAKGNSIPRRRSVCLVLSNRPTGSESALCWIRRIKWIR